jgi:hypothetical protein
MLVRLRKALLAVTFVLSFILNGSAMQAAHASIPLQSAAMKMVHGTEPGGHAKHTEKSHPCCPHKGLGKFSCTADCCASAVPVTVQASAQFIFVQYKQRPKPALALSSRISGPPSRPPQV